MPINTCLLPHLLKIDLAPSPPPAAAAAAVPVNLGTLHLFPILRHSLRRRYSIFVSITAAAAAAAGSIPRTNGHGRLVYLAAGLGAAALGRPVHRRRDA